MVHVLTKGINDSEFNQLTPWFKILGPVLELKDDLREERINLIMDELLMILDKFKKYPKYTKNMITLLFELSIESPPVKQWFEDYKAKWIWTDKWMSTRDYPTRSQMIAATSQEEGSSKWSQASTKRVTPSGQAAYVGQNRGSPQ